MTKCPSCFKYKRKTKSNRYPLLKVVSGKGERIKLLRCSICGYAKLG